MHDVVRREVDRQRTHQHVAAQRHPHHVEGLGVGGAVGAGPGQHGDLVARRDLPQAEALDEELDAAHAGPVDVGDVQDPHQAATSSTSTLVSDSSCVRSWPRFVHSQPTSQAPPTGISRAKVKPR